MEEEGGIVFYYDSIGGFGLVASMNEIDAGHLWGCYGETINGADGVEIGTGYQNTIDITNECSEVPIAASECLDYESNGFSDWFLPSKEELLEMHNTIGEELYNNGAIQNNWYWSSSEYNNNDSWYISLPDGSLGTIYKGDSDRVIPIRAFGNWTMGCMDEVACNYNSEANMADGSCEYPQLGYNCDGNINVQVGDEMFGGTVFFIDESSEYGLVAASENIGPFSWGCYGQEINGANNTFIGSGYQNTIDINNDCSDFNAATVALGYQLNGFDDWYLPSQSEILEMYNNLGNNGFQNFWYWTSTEYDENDAISINFNDGSINIYGTKFNEYYLRPIRSIGSWAMGCMDETACNYNSEANMPNGSCTYPESGYHCDGSQVEIGDFYRGGIVFYIDDLNHGLISLDHDIGEYGWGCCCGYTISGADGMAIGEGYDNTIDIHNQCSGNAATQCLNYEYLGYDDWYLPSRDELLEMMYVISQSSNIGNIGNFDYSRYWSSSEETINAAYNVMFDPNLDCCPIGAYGGGKGNAYKVRPIRSF